MVALTVTVSWIFLAIGVLSLVAYSIISFAVAKVLLIGLMGLLAAGLLVSLTVRT